MDLFSICRRAIMLSVMIFAMPLTASAMSLDDAKHQGLIGERMDGYVGIVSTSTPELVALVKATNNARRNEYSRIATETGQPRNIIEQLAAKKAYELTPRGQYVQDGSGGWHKQ